MDNIWKSKSISTSTKPKLMETAVFSAVLYSVYICETRTYTKQSEKSC